MAHVWVVSDPGGTVLAAFVNEEHILPSILVSCSARPNVQVAVDRTETFRKVYTVSSPGHEDETITAVYATVYNETFHL